MRTALGAVPAMLLVLLAACSKNDVDPGPAVTFATGASTASAGTAPPAASTPASATSATSVSSATVATSATVAAPLGDPVIALTPVAEATEPVDLAWRTGDRTLFVVERSGYIRPLRDGQVGPPVLDIDSLTDAGGERGLLGLAFSPDGAHAYIDYTDNDGDTVIDEYAVAADGTFDAASRRELLAVDQPYANHNGGNVMFGPDGMLYIGMGDGGSANDPERRALAVSTLLGKILRIDPRPSAGAPYTIPPDNPFVGTDGARPEIWSVGVRNPWRMSFDRATGDMWFGDVGQNQWEEIDVAWADQGAGRGFNFGWSAFEGTHRANDDQSPDGATPPIYEYEHGDAGCSVSGGAVYRGAAIPALVGWYVFGDYCSGNLYAIRTADKVLQDSLLLGNIAALTAIREGPDGELFAISLGGQIVLVAPGG